MNRRHRLHGRVRFQLVRRGGVEGRAGLVRVRAVAGTESVCRAGVAVMGARNAVERNRARRRVRAALAQPLRAQPSVDAVVIVPAAVAHGGFARLESDVRHALHAAAQRCTR